jgi:bacteriocin-like protein
MRKEKPSKQQPTISANSSIENKKETVQLTEEELKKVSGGLTGRKAGKPQQEF